VAHGENWTTKLLGKCALLLKDKGRRIVENYINEMKHKKQGTTTDSRINWYLFLNYLLASIGLYVIKRQKAYWPRFTKKQNEKDSFFAGVFSLHDEPTITQHDRAPDRKVACQRRNIRQASYHSIHLLTKVLPSPTTF
jgi:hypothetical protein